MQTAQPSKETIYQELDEWFIKKGFSVTPLGKLMPGRKWERVDGERHIGVVCSPRTKRKYYGEVSRMKYAGHELAIEISTPLHTRIAVVPRTAISLGGVERYLMRKMDVHPLENPGEAYSHLKVNVHDKAWAQEYLGLQEVQERIRDVLIPPDGSLGSVSFSLQPGTVYYRMRNVLGAYTPDLLERTLDSLEVMTDLAEACTPPTKRAERTRLEKMGRENPVKLIMLFIGGLIALSFVFPLIAIGFIVLGFQDLFIYLVFGIGFVIAFFVWRFVRGRK